VLCEAIADMFDAADVDRIDVGFSFAATRPIDGSFPRRVVFTPDTGVVLREAATQLRASAPSHADVRGYVVKLASPSATDGGDVTLVVELERGQRRVSLTLRGDDYRRALRAHGEGLEVRCSGELAKQGNGHVLRDPKDFELIETSTA